MRRLIKCETHRGFHTSLGRAEPCTAVRRRENLRSASFRDYAMAAVSRAPNIKKRCGLTASQKFD